MGYPLSFGQMNFSTLSLGRVCSYVKVSGHYIKNNYRSYTHETFALKKNSQIHITHRYDETKTCLSSRFLVTPYFQSNEMNYSLLTTGDNIHFWCHKTNI